jgi:hypothetical protein
VAAVKTAKASKLAHRRGVLSAGEQIVWADLGHLVDVSGAARLPWGSVAAGGSADAMLGWTDKKLVIVARDYAVAVDVAMLVRIGTRGLQVEVGYMTDRGPVDVAWIPVASASRVAEQLAALRDARLTLLPNESVTELHRSYYAAKAAGQEAEWRDSVTVRGELPVHVHRVTSDPARVPETPAGMVRDDVLVWCDGDLYGLIDRDFGVYPVPAADITYLALADVPGSGGAIAHWELGWTVSGREVRAFFEAPGMALVPGMVEHSADLFLTESGLDRHLLDLHRDARSWRTTATQRATIATGGSSPKAPTADSGTAQGTAATTTAASRAAHSEASRRPPAPKRRGRA